MNDKLNEFRVEINDKLNELLLLARNGNHRLPANQPQFVIQRCETMADLTAVNEALLDDHQRQVQFVST